jgi:PIN domain nuclease of toxin-antitoxin system
VISYLLDTHIIVWWLLDFDRLTKVQAQALDSVEKHGYSVGLSAISLRELAKMIQRGRLVVGAPLESWIEELDSHPLITIFPLTPTIAIESVRLGDDFHRDPADQIIVATARCHDLALMTADDRIRKWGKVRVV